MQIIFGPDEYTIQQVIKKLNKFYGGKANGKPFDNHDISVYLRRGKLPNIYGGNELKWMRLHGLTAVTVLPQQTVNAFQTK